jgi:hypothetical protein
MQIKILALSILTFLGFSQLLPAQALDHVQGEILIRFRNTVEPQSWTLPSSALRRKAAAPRIDHCIADHFRIWSLRFDWTKINEYELLAELRRHPDVEAAQFNHFASLRSRQPNDPLYGDQWYLKNTGQRAGFTPGVDLGMEEAWELSTGGVTPEGDTIVICVIDNGLDTQHEDFADNIWYNHNEIPNNGVDDDNNGYVDDYRGWHVAKKNDAIDDQNWHGTITAGIIGAKGNNETGVTGINWNTKLMIVVGGFGQAVESKIIEAYEYALTQRKLYNQTDGERGAFVVATNSSWGVSESFPEEYPLWCAVYDSLGMQGVINIAATDNKNVDVDAIGDMPTACESDFLITVTNIGGNGAKVADAGFGATSIDLGAFGDQIFMTGDGNAYTEDGGTSFAAPMVSGAVGLLYAASCPTLSAIYKESPPDAALLVKDLILRGVVPEPSLADITLTGGRLNIHQSLQILADECGDCPPLLQVGPKNLTDTYADLSWLTNDLINRVDFRFRQLGETQWQEVTNAISPINYDNLLACTSYEYQFKVYCSEDTLEYNDQIYSFTTDGCCDAPEGLRSSFVGNISMLLDWEPVLAAEDYTLRYREAGTPTWINRFSPRDDRSVQSLETCTTYEFQVRSNCIDENSPYSPSVILTTLGCGACLDLDYCTPTEVDASRSASEWIANVLVHDFANNSEGDGYTDYSDLASTTLTMGDTVRLVLTPGYTGFAFEEYFKVWIDYNQDGFFSSTDVVFDAPELATETVDTNIIIPADIPAGKTRMRVIMKFNSEPSSCVSDAVNFFGEIEDYCVTIAAPNHTATLNPLRQMARLQVFPNPASTQVQIQIHTKEQIGLHQLEVLDLDGKPVWQEQRPLLPKGKNRLQLATDQWVSGIYFVRLRSTKGTIIQKLLIQ